MPILDFRTEQRRAPHRPSAWRGIFGILGTALAVLLCLPAQGQVEESGTPVAQTQAPDQGPPPSPEELQDQSAAPALPPGEPPIAGARPRFVSLRSASVNMREGPSTEHRVKWIYQRQGLPVQVLAEYDVWRRVRDMDGEVGWVHVALLSGERTVVVTGTGYAPMRAGEDPGSSLIAEVEPGVVGRIVACEAISCELNVTGITGWVDRERLWGVYADEHL